MGDLASNSAAAGRALLFTVASDAEDIAAQVAEIVAMLHAGTDGRELVPHLEIVIEGAERLALAAHREA